MGAINVSPPPKKQKSNFHSQLLKESVSCDAFLLDINRSREEQVTEGKQPQVSEHVAALIIKQAFKNELS